MSTEFVTRDEHLAAVKRLDEADASLRGALVETERYLRKEMTDAVESAAESLHADIGDVKQGLQWQNRTLGSGLLTVLVLVVVAYVTHHYGI